MDAASYLLGFATPFAMGLGVAVGQWWWARQRRVQATDDRVVTGARVRQLPTLRPPPQDTVRMGRVRYGANVPGKIRRVRGSRPRRLDD